MKVIPERDNGCNLDELWTKRKTISEPQITSNPHPPYDQRNTLNYGGTDTQMVR